MYWSNLPDAKRPRRTDPLFAELVDNGGLSDPGISENQYQLRRTISHDALEAGK